MIVMLVPFFQNKQNNQGTESIPITYIFDL